MKISTVALLVGFIAAVVILRVLVLLILRRREKSCHDDILSSPCASGGEQRRIVISLAMACMIGVVLLGALAIFANSLILSLDGAIHSVFATLRGDPTLVFVFSWISVLGTGPALTGIALTASAYLLLLDRRSLIAPLWCAFIAAQATTWALKYLIGRERPEFIEGVVASAPSFPSGHATGALVVTGFIAYSLAQGRKDLRTRFEAYFWAAMIVALIGFSRVFLSVHYATDVFAGYLVGAFWLFFAIILIPRRS